MNFQRTRFLVLVLAFLAPTLTAAAPPRLKSQSRVEATPARKFRLDRENKDEPADSKVSAYIDELRRRNLLLPVENTSPEEWKDSFFSRRSHGMHRAADMMVEMDSPIRAVEDGTIARLKYHPMGGITIYLVENSQEFVYYYAHLSRYQGGLKVGDQVKRGQIIGFVGQTGNARSPHLHFQICKLDSPDRVWDGTPINPYDVFAKDRELSGRDKRLHDES